MGEQNVVIVGAGLMGAASAWALARRGRAVTVLEQYDEGHALGSSHGSARIVRRAYGDALYTRLAGRAFELWRELEHVSGATVLRMLGGLDFGPDRDVSGVARHLADAGVPHELLSGADAETRWPGMVFNGPVVFHPQAGTMDADAARRALLAEAARLGADVRHGTGPASVALEADTARVRTPDGAEHPASVVVVAAGGWVTSVLDGLVELPAIHVDRQQVFHFERREPSAPPWPSVIHEAGRAVYHLAGGRDGGPGDDRKLGLHDDGVRTTAGEPGEVLPAARERAVEYVRRWLPGLVPEPRGEATCLYTMTPSEDFLLDRMGPIVVCSPCSGHGAKFAPLVGELVADLVLDPAHTVPDRFRLDVHRAGLTGSVSL